MLRHRQNGEQMTVCLTGEIDHCAAQTLRLELEELIAPAGVKRLRLDFSDVTFMDSSGIGMLIGRYKTMSARGGSVSACGLSAQTEKLFRMAGLHRIISIEKDGGKNSV